MREIQFRAWDKETSKMYYQINKPRTDENIDDELIVQFDCTGYSVRTKNKYIRSGCLMQFTGLLDKNGKKIFEGDIVKIVKKESNEFHFEIYDPNPLVSEIFYDKAGFFVKGITDMDFYLGAVNEEIEVIGNIFENPELKEKCVNIN